MTAPLPRSRFLVATLLLVVLSLTGLPFEAAAAPRLPRGQWPLAGSPEVVRPFDPPLTPYGVGHRGVDLAAARGAPVLAAADGRVVFAGVVAGRGVVSIDHGGVRTTYEPVTAQVAAGQAVRAGDPIGMVGSGGHCARRCLHWGLRAGREYLNPLLLVQGSSAVALVPADRRAVVERAAAARARAAELATAGLGATGWVMGPGGRHGFAHPVSGAITSALGLRLHPVLGVWKLHDGTDFGAGCGTPIRAPYAGRVTSVGSSRGYGNRLLLDHGRVDGRVVVTAYNHAQRYVVGRGQAVTKGQVLGYVGSTGYSTGCHLHLMVWLDGRLTNPMSWFSS